MSRFGESVGIDLVTQFPRVAGAILRERVDKVGHNDGAVAVLGTIASMLGTLTLEENGGEWKPAQLAQPKARQ